MADHAALQQQVESLEAVIRDMKRRLDQLEDEPLELPEAIERAEIPTRADPTTDRRHLVTTAAALAAGAVIGGSGLTLAHATPAEAAAGTWDGNPAVTGSASPSSGIGVVGQAVTGTGVYGSAQDGTGVYGLTSSGTGVTGNSTFGNGVAAFTGSGVAVVAATDPTGSQLLLGGSPLPPTTSSTYRNRGSIVYDTNGDLWLCTSAGTPGIWRKLSGPNTAGAFHALPTPIRVYDSRPGFAPATGVKTKLVGGVARTCDLKANGSGVPLQATAVSVSIVATGTTGALGGFLAVYRNGIAYPNTSSLNWSAPNQNVAVTTITAVDPTGNCNLYANLATDVIVDVLGYYR